MYELEHNNGRPTGKVLKISHTGTCRAHHERCMASAGLTANAGLERRRLATCFYFCKVLSSLSRVCLAGACCRPGPQAAQQPSDLDWDGARMGDWHPGEQAARWAALQPLKYMSC